MIANPHMVLRLFRRPDAEAFAREVVGEANRLRYQQQSARTVAGKRAELPTLDEAISASEWEWGLR